ncbi:Helix-turn-helix domain protein [Legionella sainthelensi]|uniref:Helix-turn-helix domain protein n=1 Tax=Legionella sainthelensi TaxID=28087 RepID=A0A0W0YPJ3_9GAMM|nr:helix-turn-helix transcriptional regulator [Legionella sainthelensi]KTD58791.1 Helix-turn-helix domain protein [Legionella sainthelensi]VEH34162.1 Helix-turn-helix domain [Legionella sainthelensi]
MANSPLPKRLKEARTAAGMSQKQLGIAAGMDEFSASPRINQYETGKHTPDFLTLKRIAMVLSVPTAYFYAEEDDLAELIRLFFLTRTN